MRTSHSRRRNISYSRNGLSYAFQRDSSARGMYDSRLNSLTRANSRRDSPRVHDIRFARCQSRSRRPSRLYHNDFFARRPPSCGYARRTSNESWPCQNARHDEIPSRNYGRLRTNAPQVYQTKAMTRRSRTRERRKERPPPKKAEGDDEIVHFHWHPGMKLSDNLRVTALLGEGTFGRVVECVDRINGATYAAKVIRDVERYTSAAAVEVSILKEVARADPENQSHCVRLYDSFMYKSRHMCLVFERLGLSLFDLLTQNEYRGYYLEDIQSIASQCLKSLEFMRQIGLTHTDLKPENILFVTDRLDWAPPVRTRASGLVKRPQNSTVKIIDFGSATFEGEPHSSLINTRQYRAPEVILDIGWTFSSDTWSLGCLMMELYTGNLLFRTHEHMEHLAMMERVSGNFSQKMLSKAIKRDGRKYVAGHMHCSGSGRSTSASSGALRLKWPDGASSRNSIDRVREQQTCHKLVLPKHKLFADFIQHLLRLDPDERPTPLEALQHPFLRARIVDDEFVIVDDAYRSRGWS